MMLVILTPLVMSLLHPLKGADGSTSVGLGEFVDCVAKR